MSMMYDVCGLCESLRVMHLGVFICVSRAGGIAVFLHVMFCVCHNAGYTLYKQLHLSVISYLRFERF